MKIVESADCGNSPKNNMVQEIAIAIFTKNIDKIKYLCSEDLVWSIAGAGTYQNHSNLGKAAKKLSNRKLSEVKINTAISHEKKGTSYAIGIQNGSAILAQVNIIEFQSAKGNIISKITTMETAY